MRLDDLRSKGRDEADIPAEVERELEILDAALRGEEVPAGMEGIEALVSDLRAERPEPEPRFEAELDAWAAAGFPRGKRPGARAAGGGAGANTGGFLSRFRPDGPRGWTPIAAAAATFVVIGVSLSQIGDFGGEESPTGGARRPSKARATRASGDAAAPSAQETADDAASGARRRARERAAKEPGSVDAGLSPNSDQNSAFYQSDARTSPCRRCADARGRRQPRPGEAPRRARRAAHAGRTRRRGRRRERQRHRRGRGRERSRPELPRHRHGRAARATLEVRVPSSTLDDTLAALSELANVKSRTEQSQDITRIYVTAKDRLVGLRAERDSLAARIRAATTDAEVAAASGPARERQPRDRRREERARRRRDPRPAGDGDDRDHLRGRGHERR